MKGGERGRGQGGGGGKVRRMQGPIHCLTGCTTAPNRLPRAPIPPGNQSKSCKTHEPIRKANQDEHYGGRRGATNEEAREEQTHISRKREQAGNLNKRPSF